MSWFHRLFGEPVTECVLLDIDEEVIARQDVAWKLVTKKGKLVCVPTRKPRFFVRENVTVGGIGIVFNGRYVHHLNPFGLRPGDCFEADINVWLNEPDKQHQIR